MISTELPAAARLPALDRRGLLKGIGLGAGLVSVPLSARIGERGFTHGVASGEPGATSVLLWSRYVAEQTTMVAWEVKEADGGQVVAGGEIEASPDSDWCIKPRAEGLRPGAWYLYRFRDAAGNVSEEGRTRTLPQGAVDRFRMAVFSCANIGYGWFNAYRHAAESNAFDLLVHTGDYFYEYQPGRYPSADQALPGRFLDPRSETVNLADYRLRHATYRRDPDLRRLTQLYPMILGWDDHESANDSYATGAENHQPETEGEWSVRKRAAVRAYREWLPVSDEDWASYEIGDLATIFRLETRLEARSKQFSIGDVLQEKSSPEEAMRALIAFRDGDYRDPARTVLGAQQETWLADGLRRSKAAGKTWQVLAQQVLMGSSRTPGSLATAVGDAIPEFARQRLLAAVLAGSAGIPFNMDAWDGYPAARERLFAASLEAGADLLVLAGDTHNAWAFELDHAGEKVGVEFGGQSVTSPGAESYLSAIDPRTFASGIVSENPQLKWADTSQRGYLAVELTPERAIADYHFLGSIRQQGTALAGTKRITSVAGSRTLDIG
ncbi:alkaline phosphatase D family protein [Erythrobacter litoralis]|uniref:Alkaline phosphatase, putative n=1 Tax=Erythrobacter litoralis (strain HTCC2594) TaxID=314225 RepID=Q2N6X3_ERYLH|nr:alkaline phosphatase D family protein [Erythrobacter litoralis]ABC64568.1 alkaline phosphatase, putative [Erythrobacter litoralis HTCC2594]